MMTFTKSLTQENIHINEKTATYRIWCVHIITNEDWCRVSTFRAKTDKPKWSSDKDVKFKEFQLACNELIIWMERNAY